MQKSILFSITEALLGASLCPPSEFQTFPRRTSQFRKVRMSLSEFRPKPSSSSSEALFIHGIKFIQQYALPSSRVWLKPWPNGLASRRKLKTWVHLRLRLARVCVHLRWLAMTCAHFGRDQICTQVKASFSSFGHPTQINASWVTSINLLLVNEIEDSLP